MAGADIPAGGGRGGRRRVSIHIDMTPMVDVIILLLIFFFMTSQFKEPAAVEVKLPKLGAGEKYIRVKQTNVLTVKVDEKGNVVVVDATYGGGKEMTLKELGEYIGASQQGNAELVTIIDVSPDAKYQHMMDVLDEFKQASERTKVRKVSLRLEEIPETAAEGALGG
jgi:biopolymer transport protein ExbD